MARRLPGGRTGTRAHKADAVSGRRAVEPRGGLAGRRLRAGFAWAGNPRYKADSQRSTKLETLMPLLRIPGITWISLQNGPAAKELSGLPGNVFVWDGASGDRDLAE